VSERGKVTIRKRALSREINTDIVKKQTNKTADQGSEAQYLLCTVKEKGGVRRGQGDY